MHQRARKTIAIVSVNLVPDPRFSWLESGGREGAGNNRLQVVRIDRLMMV